MAIIDATDLVLGRMASNVADELIKGRNVIVVNAEKAIITGNKQRIFERFKKRFDLSAKGNPHKGPKYSKMPDRIVRRTIRGMLPWKKSAGKTAFKRLKVFIGLPEEFKSAKLESINSAKLSEEKKFVYVGELSKMFGVKL